MTGKRQKYEKFQKKAELIEKRPFQAFNRSVCQ